MSASTVHDETPDENATASPPRPVRWPRMRPRFTVELACSADQVMEVLRGGAALRGRALEARFSERHGLITIPEAERQFWSTQLGITVEDPVQGEDGRMGPARLLGVFSPHPEIWTSFVFAIGVLTASGIFAAMYSVVQLSMGQAPWCLLASLIAALAGGLVYTTTLVGQGLAADEMYRLRSYLDDCLEEAEARARRTPGTAGDSAQL
jgi:hypothetical protein